MRQLLLRVPDELHERLSARARADGRSINMIANEVLDLAVTDRPVSVRDLIRARASAAGILATTGRGAIEAPPIEVVWATLRGAELSAQESIDEQRGGAR